MEVPDSSPAAGGETGSRLGVRFYRYRAVLKRYWWVLALCVTLGLAYEAYVVFTKPTRYVSVAKLSVRETSNDETSLSRRMDPSWYGTIIKTIESPAVRERAKKIVAVQKPGQENGLDAVKITAENEVNTYFFAVRAVGPSPEFTAYSVDRVMEAFMEMRREESRASAEHDLTTLKGQSEAEQGLVEEAQRSMEQFIEKENVPFIEQQALQIAEDLADLRKTREALLGEINTVQNMDDGSLLNKGGNTKRSNDSDVRGDQWIEKQQELAIKQNELATRAEIWKPAHPRYRQLQDEIDKLKVAIEVLKDQASKGRTAAISRLKAEVVIKEKAIVEYEQKARDFSKVLTRHKNLLDEVTRRQTNYNHTRETLDKMRLTAGSPEILTIQQRASAPEEENRGVLKGLLTGFFGGLILGLGILFLLDRADDRLASSSEMIEQFNEPILAQIPDVADSRTQGGLPLLQEEDDRYMYAEAFRSLRSSLIFMPNQTELKTLIITSAIPNEGKSTIASNLAITMANAGARVLLVDADLRRGDIAALFDTDGRQGLANILRGEVAWKDCIKSFKAEKLHIIPRGPVTNQSGELLLQPTLPKLLAEWKSTYDLVIFNTAPILATDDTPTVAPNFDGTLMVIRASFTSARLTRNSLNALYQRQVNVLGLILNCVDTEMPDYYYYRYPKYYAA